MRKALFVLFIISLGLFLTSCLPHRSISDPIASTNLPQQSEDSSNKNPDNTDTNNNTVILHIEDAPAGYGKSIDTLTINNGEVLDLYAVSRDNNDVFISDENVVWSMSDELGGFSYSSGDSTTFKPYLNNGTLSIYATHNDLGNTNTGDITINWQGLVGSWAFEDNCEDASGEGNHGNNNGASFVIGKSGQGININDAGQYVAIPDNDTLDLSNTGTITAWIKMDKFVKYAGIVHKGDSTNFKDEAYSLQFWNTKKVRLYLDTKTYIQTTTNINEDEWYHITATWNKDGIAIYINGEPDNYTTKTATVKISDGDINIGAQLKEDYNNKYKNYPFYGTIDEVSIWNKALSEDEVMQLYRL